MKINTPIIKTDKDFVKYVKIFDNYAELYNKDKKLKEQLRASHRELYFTLIHLYRAMLLNHNKVLKDNPDLCMIDSLTPPSLYTNRRILKQRLKKDGSTIYRHIERLIKAEVILEKKFHGVNQSFELLINPEFLLIYDNNYNNYQPTSKFLQTKKSTFQSVSRANCTRFGIFPEQSNNIISNVDNLHSQINFQKINIPKLIQNQKIRTSKNFEKFPNKQSKTLPKPIQNTQKQEKNFDNTKKNKTKIALNLTKQSFSRWFYKYLIAMLFSDKNIYPAEREKTLQYIFQNYFANCLTQKACENFAKQLKWRVDATKRYINRKNFDFSNIYPAQYLNLNNHSSGFVNTQKWWFDSVKYHKNKQKINTQNKILQSDYDKLNKKIRFLLKNYNLENYKCAENYVLKNIPHLKNEFYNRIIK